MKSQKPAKYVEWLNADIMHEASRNWLSELRFIKDEQQFLSYLIKSYTLQLIDASHFAESKNIVETLEALQKKNKKYIETVKAHENELLIMVDGIDQLQEEEAYRNKHRTLLVNINYYYKEYRKLKKQVFRTIEDIMKHEKQKRLLQ
jgi:Ni,Fe-hydrogenase maturation factor